jgi:phosphoribosyl 1,2-cyclic phosphodiesterase
MKITFLGTRGYIDIRTKAHHRHTMTMVTIGRKRILIDCGIDWLKYFKKLDPEAIMITHAHPDHAWGLREGAPCPVYATKESWELMKHYPIQERCLIVPRIPTRICGTNIEAFTVEHSLKAPGIGYRITGGNSTIFCVHDLVYIHQPQEALAHVQVYIGDGATISRPLIRKRDSSLIGHSSIKTQLAWCKKYQIPRAYFTHCGTEIVGTDGRTVHAIVTKIGHGYGVDVHIAHDNQTVIL